LKVIELFELPDGNQVRTFENKVERAYYLFREIYESRIYEKKTRVKTGMNVIDLGANIGIFTLKASKQVGENGHVLAVEPNPLTRNILKWNIKHNDRKNVTVIPYAVSNENCTSLLRVNLEHVNESTLREEKFANQKNYHVKVRRLEDALNELKWQTKPINFIKIDVEGYELQALQGLGCYLKKIRHFAVASYHYEGEEKVIHNFLVSNGFSAEISLYYRWFYVYARRNDA